MSCIFYSQWVSYIAWFPYIICLVVVYLAHVLRVFNKVPIFCWYFIEPADLPKVPTNDSSKSWTHDILVYGPNILPTRPLFFSADTYIIVNKISMCLIIHQQVSANMICSNWLIVQGTTHLNNQLSPLSLYACTYRVYPWGSPQREGIRQCCDWVLLTLTRCSGLHTSMISKRLYLQGVT
jgi:hypothetical protein